MIQLPKSGAAWGLPCFKETLKAEIESLNGDLLPLQQGLRQSSHAITDHFSVTILATSEDPDYLHIKAGIFYSGIIAGCHCADDPTPVEAQTEYCEIMVDICKLTANTTVKLFA